MTSRPDVSPKGATPGSNGITSKTSTNSAKGVPAEMDGATSTAASETTRLAILADLLADLPQAERRDVIAALFGC